MLWSDFLSSDKEKMLSYNLYGSSLVVVVSWDSMYC